MIGCCLAYQFQFRKLSEREARCALTAVQVPRKPRKKIRHELAPCAALIKIVTLEQLENFAVLSK